MFKKFRNKKSLLWLASLIIALILGFIAGIYVANNPIDPGASCDASNCGLNQ